MAEIASEDEVNTAEELHVPLPNDNATFHSLAVTAAADLPRSPANKSPAESRRLLRDILRYRPLAGKMEALGRSETDDGVTIERFRLELGPQWQLPAVVASGRNANRTVLMLADSGYAGQAKQIADWCAAGSRVICLDPILIGQSTSEGEAYSQCRLVGHGGPSPLGHSGRSGFGRRLAVLRAALARLAQPGNARPAKRTCRDLHGRLE